MAISAAQKTFIVGNDNRFINKMVLKGYTDLRIDIKYQIEPYADKEGKLICKHLLTVEQWRQFFHGSFADAGRLQSTLEEMRDNFFRNISGLRDFDLLTLKYEVSLVASKEIGDKKVGEFFEQKGTIEGIPNSPIWNTFIGLAPPQNSSVRVEALLDSDAEISTSELSLNVRALI